MCVCVCVQIIKKGSPFAQFHIRLRIPEPSCTKKEIASIDIFTVSRNDDRKIIQPTRTRSRASTKNIFKTASDGPHFDDAPRVQQ